MAVDPGDFAAKFGAPVEDLTRLRNAKTVTIPSLMEIAPAGTVDPTPFLYDTTMYVMAGLLGLAFFANLLVMPVDPKYHCQPPGLLQRPPANDDHIRQLQADSDSRTGTIKARAQMLNSMLE